MNSDRKDTTVRNIFFVLFVWICFPTIGFLIHTISIDGPDLAGMSLHLLSATGLSVAVTIFFGLQQRELAQYSRREFELKQSPHVSVSQISISQTGDYEFTFSQTLTNVGMGSVFVSGARIEWSGILNRLAGQYIGRGRYLSELPVQIVSGQADTFDFTVSIDDITPSDKRLEIQRSLKLVSAIHVLDAEISYQIRNTGANEVRELRQPVFATEQAIKKRLVSVNQTKEASAATIPEETQ